jgi:putative hydrolase of the HAD superfamily
MLLLFDIDGVVNKANYFTEAYQNDFGVSKDVFDLFFQYHFPATLTNEKDLATILPAFFENWNWKGSSEGFIEYWFQNDVNIDMELILLIRHYRRLGIRVGIASQQEKHRMNYLLNIKRLADEFDCFYFSCELGFLKSDVNFYHTITGLEQQLIYFWDDTRSVMDLANECGWTAYLYSDNLVLKQEIDRILAVHEI